MLLGAWCGMAEEEMYFVVAGLKHSVWAQIAAVLFAFTVSRLACGAYLELELYEILMG